ncbi:PPE protein [Gordonia terrae C-6]|uniref:PPE protein n=1 Tax=Gordonia terrae C-6 TaxID=1316928 RepID=R7YAR8_9ACTN|nr:PPE domain-containing protein [Gordonia terrae]EON33087.1 PPE protein [Gordonia terrae C-6]
MIGFTGVNWDARPTAQLAADLGAGPGPAPLAEAGMAWAALATEIGEAGVEFTAVLARLGVHWQSAHSSAAFEELTRLAPWFAEVASEAVENAARAESQAAAITVARLNMPDLAEVDVVEKLHTIATTATAIAPIIAGAAAQAERAVAHQRMRAARVMQTYESAAEPVATPWKSARPAPGLVSGDALAAEQAAATRESAPPPAPVSTAPPIAAMPVGVGGVFTPPPEKLRYAPTIVAGVQPQVATTTPGGAPVTSAPGSGPGVPPPVAPGVATADRGAVVRTISADAADLDSPDESTSSATESTEQTATWADLATSDRPAAHYVSAPDRDGHTDVDPRYLSETLMLGAPGEHR